MVKIYTGLQRQKHVKATNIRAIGFHPLNALLISTIGIIKKKLLSLMMKITAVPHIKNYANTLLIHFN